jgi:hypothetical protein
MIANSALFDNENFGTFPHEIARRQLTFAG